MPGRQKKKGCYRAFCAEYKHLGLDAIELVRRFQACDDDDALRIQSKWKDKLEPTPFARFCADMKGSGCNGVELAKQFHQMKPTLLKKSVQKKRRACHLEDIDVKTVPTSVLKALKGFKQLKHLECRNKTGYRFIVRDKKLSNAPYRFSIKLASTRVESKGFVTAQVAAEAFLQNVKHWLGATAHKQNDGPDIVLMMPPDGWTILSGDSIIVDVQDVGWTPCVVGRVLSIGTFSARIVISGDEWEDVFHWSEEGYDWRRGTSVDAMGGRSTNQEVPQSCAALEKDDFDDKGAEVEEVGSVLDDDEMEVEEDASDEEEANQSFEESDEMSSLARIRTVCAKILKA